MQFEKFKQDAATKLCALWPVTEAGRMGKDEALDHVEIMEARGDFEGVQNVGQVYTAVKQYVAEQSGLQPAQKQDIDDFDWTSPDDPQVAPVDFNEYVKERVNESKEKNKAERAPLPSWKQEPDAMLKESPVVVYPMPQGGVVFRGIKYSVTMREGATAEQALALLGEWDRFWKLGKEYGVEPMQGATTLQQEPGDPYAAPPSAGQTAQPKQPTTTDNNRTALIHFIQREARTSKAGNDYECWVPFRMDDNGDPKRVSKNSIIPAFGAIADQMRAIVSEDVRRVYNQPVRLPPDQMFVLLYHLEQNSSGNGSHAVFDSIEAPARRS